MLSLINLAKTHAISAWSFALDSSSHYVFTVYGEQDVVLAEKVLSYAKCKKLAQLLSWQVQS